MNTLHRLSSLRISMLLITASIASPQTQCYNTNELIHRVDAGDCFIGAMTGFFSAFIYHGITAANLTSTRDRLRKRLSYTEPTTAISRTLNDRIQKLEEQLEGNRALFFSDILAMPVYGLLGGGYIAAREYCINSARDRNTVAHVDRVPPTFAIIGALAGIAVIKISTTAYKWIQRKIYS